MNLSDRLHCPDCRGRLDAHAAAELRCSECGRTFALVDGIADFISGSSPLPPAADRYHGITRDQGLLAADLPTRIKSAAGGSWPSALGDVIELGCGLGAMTRALLTGEAPRSLLVVDTDPAMLQQCRRRIAALEIPPDTAAPVAYAAFGGEPVIRDAVADTVIGTAVLSDIADARSFLTTVHRILRIGGRALFVMANRRYRAVACMALAEALAQRYARDGAWPEGSGSILGLLAQTRRLLIHPEDRQFAGPYGERHLFESDSLEDLAAEVGFATAEVIPLDPDPAGGETITTLCRDAGATEEFARLFGPLAATIGRPFLRLLSHQDSSAFSLLSLAKAPGPAVRIYTGRPGGPAVNYIGPDTIVGGVMPRWSVELLARDTADGIVVTVGGWCLANIDVLSVKIALDGVVQSTPVWRQRPDVHEVLNRAGLWHPLHALCSGLGEDLLFQGVHAQDDSCPLRLEIVLAGGLTVTGPAPERLTLNQPTVIAH